MEKEEIFEDVKKIIVEKLGVNEKEVNLKSKIRDDLGADSLDQVDIVMTFEEKFEIQIPDEDTEGIETVGDIVEYIFKKISG